MEILNYTGKRIGLFHPVLGRPERVLPSHGNARCEIQEYKRPSENSNSIKVKGLPSPDFNLQKQYIVSREVAEVFGSARKDLLIPENPIPYEGALFYTLNKVW